MSSGEHLGLDPHEDAPHQSSIRLPRQLDILPLASQPFFPAQVMPLLLHDDWQFDVAEDALAHRGGLIGLVAMRDGAAVSHVDGCHTLGTLARVHRFHRDNGRVQYLAEGLCRFKIATWLTAASEVPRARVSYPACIAPRTPATLNELRTDIMMLMEGLLKSHPRYTDDFAWFMNGVDPQDLSLMTDFAASLCKAETGILQQILETLELELRMRAVKALLREETQRNAGGTGQLVAAPAPSRALHARLKRELRTVERALGIEPPGKAADIAQFESRLEELQLPAPARLRADQELARLQTLEPANQEYAVVRNYLDCLTGLPWGMATPDCLDLARARRLLDAEHGGLEDVKRRILEFLAVATLRQEVAGSIILLVGPPGVGKTSIGRSIANVLKRRFYRMSLGGMKDEAAIKGHRRTYIGAQPGQFIQAVRDAGACNPVILLDEIDKIGVTYQGDPGSALLEVLDPEQNRDFRDHYLDVPFDLSRTLFICTANDTDDIPDALLDRMEVIRLTGYITEEKTAIARDHLWPRLVARTGLSAADVRISTPAIRQVIEGYAREAGVRNVEKQLGRLVRKAAVDIVAGATRPVRIGVEDVPRYLGAPVFGREKPMRAVGVATGLAWTGYGGALLPLEASRVHTLNRGFNLTGNVGDVMYESAELAYSYVCAHLQDWRADPSFFDEAYVHLHIPEGAIPKDGPSAGIAMACALLSLALNRKPWRTAAMTGEMTLTGQVLAVGGVREKVLAARRAGITEIILPEASRREYDKLQPVVRAEITPHFIRHFNEVAALMFGTESAAANGKQGRNAC